MNIAKFEECNVQIAKNQKEYLTLYAHKKPDGEVIYCFEPTKEELAEINKTGKIWFRQLTFNNPLQPIMCLSEKPEMEAVDLKGIEVATDELKKQNTELTTLVNRYMLMMSKYLDKQKGREPSIANLFTVHEFSEVVNMPREQAKDTILELSKWGYVNIFTAENGVRFYQFTFRDRVKNMQNNENFYLEKILEWKTALYRSQQLIKILSE